METKFFAHRGLSSKAPENSIVSFILAARYGFDGVECDIQTTKDGKWIVFHDDNLERMTGVNVNVSDVNYDQVKELNLINGENVDKYPPQIIPTIEDFLDVCQMYKITPVIEIKACNNKKELDNLVKILSDYQFEDVYVISFRFDYLVYMKKQYEAHYQFITYLFTNMILKQCKKQQIDLDLWYKITNKPVVEAIKDEELKVNTFTIDDEDKCKELMTLGVDYITSNLLKQCEVQ